MRTQSREVGGAAGPQVDRTVGGAAVGMRSGSSSPAKVQGLSSGPGLCGWRERFQSSKERRPE